MHNSKPSAFSCSYIVSYAIELRCVYSCYSGSAIIPTDWSLSGLSRVDRTMWEIQFF